MSKGHNNNLSRDDIVDEIIEHHLLEKVGVLPQHQHTTSQAKAKKKRNGVWFYIIGYSVIGIELWVIYKAILAL